MLRLEKWKGRTRGLNGDGFGIGVLAHWHIGD